MPVNEVLLADALTQVRDVVVLAPGTRYQTCGVSGKARGLFIREKVDRAELKTDRLYKVRAGQFVYNRLFAGNGSFAVVPPSADGLLVSNEFPVFDVDTSILMPEYLLRWFSLPATWEMVAGESTGSTQSRSRWKEQQLLAVKVPAPDLPAQRRIVDLLSAADRVVEAVTAEHRAAQSLQEHLLLGGMRSLAEAPDGNTGLRPLRTVATIQYGKGVRSGDRTPCGFPYVASAGAIGFTSDPLVAHDVVVVGRKGNVGSVQVVRGGCTPSDTTVYLTPDTNLVLLEYLALALKAAGLGSMEQSSAVPGLSATRLADVEMLVPPLSAQRRIVDLISSADKSVEALEARRSEALLMRDQLLPGLLSGSHTIPESYDRFFAVAAS
jgi:restriction endonuclease S subunit